MHPSRLVPFVLLLLAALASAIHAAAPNITSWVVPAFPTTSLPTILPQHSIAYDTTTDGLKIWKLSNWVNAASGGGGETTYVTNNTYVTNIVYGSRTAFTSPRTTISGTTSPVVLFTNSVTSGTLSNGSRLSWVHSISGTNASGSAITLTYGLFYGTNVYSSTIAATMASGQLTLYLADVGLHFDSTNCTLMIRVTSRGTGTTYPQFGGLTGTATAHAVAIHARPVNLAEDLPISVTVAISSSATNAAVFAEPFAGKYD